jgi:hypothetical protein
MANPKVYSTETGKAAAKKQERRTNDNTHEMPSSPADLQKRKSSLSTVDTSANKKPRASSIDNTSTATSTQRDATDMLGKCAPFSCNMRHVQSTC